MMVFKLYAFLELARQTKLQRNPFALDSFTIPEILVNSMEKLLLHPVDFKVLQLGLFRMIWNDNDLMI